MWGENLGMQRSKKQNVVARSSAKTEFRFVAHGVCEVLWLKKLLEKLKISVPLSIKVYCDKKSPTATAPSSWHNKRCGDWEALNQITCLPYVPSINQVANILTKELHKKQLDSLVFQGNGRHFYTNL